MNYLAFDLETARLIPEGENWRAHRPLGISCYGLAWRREDGVQTTIGHGKNGVGMPLPQMSREECRALVEELADRMRQGFTLLTWNGVGFDFNILAEESGMHMACCELARAHVDMMFHFFCRKGHTLGLDRAAKGMGLAGKMEGMDGSQAPLLWQSKEYDKVLAYLTQDVITTLNLAEEVAAHGRLRWSTRGGKANRVAIPRWLSVSEALALPLPKNTWVRNPMTRQSFISWMEQSA
jgi:hypothetical protein